MSRKIKVTTTSGKSHFFNVQQLADARQDDEQDWKEVKTRLAKGGLLEFKEEHGTLTVIPATAVDSLEVYDDE